MMGSGCWCCGGEAVFLSLARKMGGDMEREA